ncbi:MAG: signal peptide peptidase SppA, partial [Desulfovibrionales bacterium]
PWEYMDSGLNRIRGAAPEIGEDTALFGYMDLSGTIMHEAMVPGSVLTTQTYITPSRVRKELDAFRERTDLNGVVLNITTPGGSVAASDELARLIQIFNSEEVPVYVYAPGLLASGGYYMAAPASAIFSAPQAMIGSIGVIFQSMNVQKLAEDKLGVKVRIFKEGQYKDMGSPFKELTSEEERIIQEQIGDAYGAFLDTILSNRNISQEELEKAATGRIFTGKQAREMKLVDDVLYLDQLRDRLNAAHDTKEIVFVRHREPASPLQDLLQGMFAPSPRTVIDQLGPLSRIILPSGLYYLME